MPSISPLPRPVRSACLPNVPIWFDQGLGHAIKPPHHPRQNIPALAPISPVRSACLLGRGLMIGPVSRTVPVLGHAPHVILYVNFILFM